MTVKKIALLGLASVATLGMSISMAGGPAACAPAAQVSGVYVGADVGARYDSTYNFDDGTVGTVSRLALGNVNISAARDVSRTHVPWGWTASGLIGYQFNNNWALQFGYIWEQDSKISMIANGTKFNGSTGPTFSESRVKLKLQSYNLYVALKGMLPLWDDFSAYMLVGPAWTHLKQTGTFTNTALNYSETGSYWSPLGALGVAWNLDDAFSVNVQYTYIMGDMTGNDNRTIDGNHQGTQRITLGANYLFAV